MKRLTTGQLAAVIWTVLVILLICGRADAASTRTYATVVFTNLPVQSNTIALNGDLRTWLTNVVNATNQITKTNTVGGNVTNLYSQAVIHPWASEVDTVASSLTSTSVVFAAQKNQILVVQLVGGYGYVTYTTNPVNDAYGVAMPFTVESTTSRTNIATGLVSAMDGYAKTAFSETNKALENFLSKTQTQTASNKTLEVSSLRNGTVVNATSVSGTNANLTNGTIVLMVVSQSTYSGIVSNLTNGTLRGTTIDGSRLTNVSGLAGSVHQIIGGVYSNGTLISPVILTPVLSNAVVMGNTTVTGASLSLIGSGVNNFVSITATSTIAAVGPIMLLSREHGITNPPPSGDVLGLIGFTGWGTTAQKIGARIRAFAQETFSDTASGSALLFETTPLGTAQSVGRLHIAPDGTVTISNSLQVLGNVVAATLTGTNRQSGIPVMALETITGVAAGNNTINATNAGVRVTGSPGAAWTVAAIAGIGVDGQMFEIYNDTGYAMTIANESGFNGTASTHIRTMRGADYVSGTNAVALFRFDGNRSRWVMRAVNP